MSARRTAHHNRPDWDPSFLQRQPLFADLNELFRPQRWTDWPDSRALSIAGEKYVDTDPADVPRFVPQPAGQAMAALEYEQHITRHDEVRTRERNWHDLFNALTWWLFPRTRRWLSAAHAKDGDVPACGRRSRRRDALTLFDECGVVLLAVDGSPLPRLHAEHRWRELFVTRRAHWGPRATAMILGHGLYEQCLDPYVGLTGKALWLQVPATLFELPLAQRYAAADRALAARLAPGRELRDPRELLPLPVLGVPGWWPGNRCSVFYDDQSYFRPRRCASSSS